MEDVIMSTIEIIFSIIGIALSVCGGIWLVFEKIFKFGKIAQRIDDIENNVKDIKNSTGNLPCSTHHDDITKIKTVLVEKYPKASNIFSIKCSPRQLNDLGVKLFKKIDGEKFIKENKETLFDYIRRTKPLVALDVEQAASAACFSLVPTPAFNRLKDFVYNEPTWDLSDGRKYDITVNDICFVIGLKLRDLYLKEVGLQ